jgi:cyclic pyranopterin monophosphate synthase
VFDVSKKTNTLRTATARAVLSMNPHTRDLLDQGKLPKGDPIPVAKVAGIQAAKNTSQIIPYCHPIPIDHVDIAFVIESEKIIITASVKAIYKTGVEMEALTAASVAALTLYDMMKMVDETMAITGVELLEKRGGKSDYRDQFERPLRVGILLISDPVALGKKEDVAGKLVVERMRDLGLEIADYRTIPDDKEKIVASLKEYSDTMKLDLVLTSGGTALTPRDCTAEAMTDVIEKEVPGIVEAIRTYGQMRTPYAMFSRARAGVRGKTLIINLPGSRNGVAESLDAIFPAVLHAYKMIHGGGHAASAPHEP